MDLNMTDPTPAPSGLTIRDALTAAHEQGFKEQFMALSDGVIKNIDSGKTAHAADVEVDVLWRIEGASDSADELMVLAISTVDCGRGTIMLTYGPSATKEDNEVLEGLNIRGAKPGLPPEAS